jgi:hypothetical protein
MVSGPVALLWWLQWQAAGDRQGDGQGVGVGYCQGLGAAEVQQENNDAGLQHMLAVAGSR